MKKLIILSILAIYGCSQNKEEMNSFLQIADNVNNFLQLGKDEDKEASLFKTSLFEEFIYSFIQNVTDKEYDKLISVEDFSVRSQLNDEQILKRAKKHKADFLIVLETRDVKKISVIYEQDYKLYYNRKKGYYNYIIVYFKK